MARINLAVFNRKGGVGKTTLSIILTQIALMDNKKVLAVDQDTQCNFLRSVSYLKEEKQFKDSFRLKTSLSDEDFNSDDDWLIIDCPPSFDNYSQKAIKNAEIILVPVRPDIYSTLHMSAIRQRAGDHKKLFQFPLVKIGFTEAGVHDKTLAAKDASKRIADKKYSVIGDLPLYANITANISSDRRKWWCAGLTASARSPFELLYARLELLHRKIQALHDEPITPWPEKNDYYEDPENPDIALFGHNQEKKS